jgi:nitric oxide reductase activation protein
MRQILHEKKQQIQERKLLLLIATDGAPPDDDGYQTIEEFRYALQHERKPIDRVPVTIIACTGKYQSSKIESMKLNEKRQTIF